MSEGIRDKDLLLEKNVIFFSKVNRFCGFQNMYNSLLLPQPKICQSKGLYMWILKIFWGNYVYTPSMRTIATQKNGSQETNIPWWYWHSHTHQKLRTTASVM